MKGWAIGRLGELERWSAGTGEDEDEDDMETEGAHAITIAHGVTATQFNKALEDVDKLPCKFALIVRFLVSVSTLFSIIVFRTVR